MSSSPKKPVPPEHEYFAGAVVGTKYRLTSVIGEGGMGSVWRAKNLALDADVCVKLIRSDAATPMAAERLLQEARAAARLSHPGIVRVFDFGETERHDPFIVMELLRGESLREVMTRKGKLPGETAVATLLPVAAALVEAHSKGIVHRDLKPENIMLVTDDAGAVAPKIVDFGVAKMRQGGVAGAITTTEVVGSPDYMSPEQAQGLKDIDERTDVWAFTVMLYELLAGGAPFKRDNYNALLWAIQHDDPAPLSSRGMVDEALAQIVSRGLAKKREDRHQTMRELGTALAEWAVERGIEVDVTGASIAHGWLASARRPLSEAPHGGQFRLSSNPNIPVPDKLPDLELLGVPGSTAERASPLPRRASWLLVGVALLLLGGVAGSLLLLRSPVPPPAAGSAPAALSLPAPTRAAEPPPSPPSASVVAPEKPAGVSPTTECVAPLFAESTFVDAGATDFQFLCRESDPRSGAHELKMQVVKARGTGVSGGMQEWAHLGWYEMAAFAVARERCCESPVALELPSTGGVCPPLEAALTALGRDAAAGRDTEKPLRGLDETVLCLFRNGGSSRYAYSSLKLSDARSVFEKTLSRARAAAK